MKIYRSKVSNCFLHTHMYVCMYVHMNAVVYVPLLIHYVMYHLQDGGPSLHDIGTVCISDRHTQVIEQQKQTIRELRKTITEMKEVNPPSELRDYVHIQNQVRLRTWFMYRITCCVCIKLLLHPYLAMQPQTSCLCCTRHKS